jgi:SecD/SecF fusion protein
MLALSRWKIIVVVGSIIFGLLFSLPNLLPDDMVAKLPGFMPHQRLNLGLDLQGGSSLLYEVDTAALKKERLNDLAEEARAQLRAVDVTFSDLGVVGGVVSLRLSDPTQTPQAMTALAKVGGQLRSGTRDVIITQQPDQHVQIALAPTALDEGARNAVAQSIEIIRRRIDALGTKEPDIRQEGAARITIEAPGESDPQKLQAVVGQTAKLTFQMVDENVSQEDATAGRAPPDDVIAQSDDKYCAPVCVLKKRVVISGEMLTHAQQGFDPQTNAPIVEFRLNGAGAHRFADTTTQNIGRRFAIVLDGRVISAPVIQSAIVAGSGQISGNFTVESANQLALLLNSGALPAPLHVIEQGTVGADLGADAVRAGVTGLAIGAALIFGFIILAYGLFGVFAALALVVNLVLLIGLLSANQATLTLPGIAGIILTMAVAVDANVLIYERMRDEANAGRTAIAAADTGYRRAMTSIFDANVTTMISALIMFGFGAGPVKGFAWTLSIGVATSVFSSILVTQLLIGWWFRVTRAKTLPIASTRKSFWPLIHFVPRQTHFNFVGLAPYAAILSVLAVIAAGASVGTQQVNFGVDFVGGTKMSVTTPGPAPLGKIRSDLAAMGVADAQVQSVGVGGAAIQFRSVAGQSADAAATFVAHKLQADIPGLKVAGQSTVGAKVSGELIWKGLEALGVALGLTLLYIWFRFQLQFGLGAILALAHDIVLTLGFLSITRIEVSMTSIAALLTVIGYSMNEKVISFDRLRENLRKYKTTPLAEVINLSENERLSRTIITGTTALLALSGSIFNPASALFSLTATMAFGILVGTYSSIYVALPVILLWGVKRDEEEAAPIRMQPSRP